MKRKILFILHLPPPVHGAALMGNYVKMSDKINDNFECNFINLSASTNIGSIGKLGIKKAFFFFQLLLSTIRALVKKNHDICYVTMTSNGAAFYKDFFVVAILKVFRKKILLHFHNKGVEEGTKKNKINFLLYKFILGGKKTRVVLLSPNLYYDVKRYVDQKRVYYCANGIPVCKDSIFSEKKNNDPVRLLFLSNMMMTKGVFVLLEACAQLKKRNIPFECHFVGDWLDITETSFHQKATELNLSNSVYAYGKKYDEEKNLFYQQSDIFIFPSLNEAFGLVLLEAMQFNLPIIASNEGGIPDVVLDNETGYIVLKNDRTPEDHVAFGLAGKFRASDSDQVFVFERVH